MTLMTALPETATSMGATEMCGGVCKLWMDDQGLGYLKPDGVADGLLDVVVTRGTLGGGRLSVGSTVSFQAEWSNLHQKYEATTCVVTYQGASVSGSAVSLTPGDVHSGAAGGSMGAGSLVALNSGNPIGGDLWDGSPCGGGGVGGSCDGAVGYGSRAPFHVSPPDGGKGFKGEISPSDNLFIAGLPVHMTDELVREIFCAYGGIIRTRVLPDNGKGDRAALVKMARVAEASWLVQNLNGNIPLGLSTPITVRFADNRAERAKAAEKSYGKASSEWQGKGRGKWPGPYKGGKQVGWGRDYVAGGLGRLTHPLEVKMATQSNPSSTKIWVGSIPAGSSPDNVHCEFSYYGEVTDVFLRDDAKVPGRMWAFVTFRHPMSASDAVAAYQTGGIGNGAPVVASSPPSAQQSAKPVDDPMEVRFARTADGCPSSKLWIGNIPSGVTPAAIKSHFEVYGRVMDTFLKDDSRSPGRMWGFVTMADTDSADAAVACLNQRISLAKVFASSSAPVNYSDAFGGESLSGPASGAVQTSMPVNSQQFANLASFPPCGSLAVDS
eukprot:TRINITY_DN43221_c0_g1_i1.p1 TRINITY_DN43221_c0_g1~~TRINITY_DN43221_c0_g1_i1.p1  ORF type:complete len:552 (+),score=75.59 TRINITY_DN43221_c0_g1_i1:230-1885(+)